MKKRQVLWFTGLSGSGKSTMAKAVEKKLQELHYPTYILDGDVVRHGLCQDLGFSEADRKENIRRVGEVAKIMANAGLVVLVAFISPFQEDRKKVRSILKPHELIEIYCASDLATCEKRDVKGLYQRARNGEIPDFTGISSPYEIPENPELVLDTSNLSIDECVEKVLTFLKM